MFLDVVNYVLQLSAIVISSISLFQSHKSSKLQNRINVLEEKNKLYELEDREKAKVYDFNDRIGEGYSLDTIRQKVPYNVL